MDTSDSHISPDQPVCHLTSNSNSGRELLAIGAQEIFIQEFGKLDEFQDWLDKSQDWAFGILGYDLKNQIERLSSENPALCQSPQIAFFRPKEVWEKTGESWTCLSDPSQSDRLNMDFSLFGNNSQIELNPQISREIYLKAVEQVRHHIQMGDVYELNFCQAFQGIGDDIDMKKVFDKLNTLTQAPFAGFFSLDGYQLACGSPERFLCKRGDKLISQPIKGTIRRGSNKEEDELLMQKLATSPKDRSENVMITDLVRNDLSRIAQRASVRVDELFGIHSFRTVHQMISTVSCKVKLEVSFTDILRATFPMGSMTGAPKVRAMQLIEELEDFQRGWYSGSLGYIEPNGDFDFNVIIRSVMHNQRTKQVQACAGGAIVIDSSPEAEYEESMLKLKAVLQALQ